MIFFVTNIALFDLPALLDRLVTEDALYCCVL